MATATGATPGLPHGVGSIGPRFVGTAAALSVLLALGLVAYGYQVIEGEVVTGLRNVGAMGGATWGLYIVFDIYFVGVGFAGIGLMALTRLFNLPQLRPFARVGLALAIVALPLSALAVMADLGQPGRAAINLFRYGRPQSPFFGTFGLVLIACTFLALVYFYLDGRAAAARLAREPSRLQGWFRLWAAGYQDTAEERQRHERTTFWLALMAIPLLIAGISTQGYIFGIQGGSAGWYGALQGPTFLTLAAVSGVGHIIVVAALARWLLKLESRLLLPAFAWLGNLLAVLVTSTLYFLISDMLTSGYAANRNVAEITEALFSGQYAWIFWGTAGAFGVSLAMLLARLITPRYTLLIVAAASVIVNVAAIGKRFLIVVPSQTHGRLLPYETGTYAPTWVEYAIVAGLMALGALALMGLFKMFPIIAMSETKEGE